jgi:hypothetical protein
MLDPAATPIEGVGDLIRLAVAPVFLLAGVGALLCFLREVSIATAALRIGPQRR